MDNLELRLQELEVTESNLMTTTVPEVIEIMEDEEDRSFWERMASKAVAERAVAVKARDEALRQNRAMRNQVKLVGEKVVHADQFLMIRRSLERAKARAWHQHKTTNGQESLEFKGEFRAFSEALATIEDVLNGRKIG